MLKFGILNLKNPDLKISMLEFFEQHLEKFWNFHDFSKKILEIAAK